MVLKLKVSTFENAGFLDVFFWLGYERGKKSAENGQTIKEGIYISETVNQKSERNKTGMIWFWVRAGLGKRERTGEKSIYSISHDIQFLTPFFFWCHSLGQKPKGLAARCGQWMVDGDTHLFGSC